MPYRKRTKTQKRRPRYTKKFRKSVFPRSINGNNRYYRLKIQGTFDITNSVASVQDIACSVFLNTPGYVWDNTGTRVAIPFSEQWDKIGNLFDRYRVNALRIKFIPGYSPASSTANTIYMLNDYDDYSLLSVVKAMSGGATVYSRIPGAQQRLPTKLFKNPDKRFLNMNLNQTSPSATYSATATLPVDFFKSIKVVAGGCAPSVTVGQLICEWDITCVGINNNNV